MTDNIYEQLDNMNNQLLEINFDYEKEISEAIKSCPSNLDKYDYAFCLALGIASCILNTNDKISSFLDEVHQASNSSKPHMEDNKFGNILAKILKHYGDNMDRDNGNFHARNSSKGGSGPHRVFWGHDILSFSEDNPFYVSIKQYGVFKGTLQAIRHLIADTCSKQGVPLPGSSWWDYEEDEKVHNYLIDFANKYSQEVLGKKQYAVNNEVFNSMFSIHMQDILANGLITTIVSTYCKIKKIDNEIRMRQIRAISYSFNFFGMCIIDSVKSGGIPTINWVSLLSLSKNVLQLVKCSNKDTNELQYAIMAIETNRYELELKEKEIKKDALYTLRSTITGEDVLKRQELINYLGEEDNGN